MRETSVVLGIDEDGFQEEVLHFLDRLPAVRVVGAGGDPDTLRKLVRTRRPDVVVGVPDRLQGLNGVPTLAVSLRETTDALRTSIRVGARGFFLWPAERKALGQGVGNIAPLESSQETNDGLIVAIVGARGGAGATFLATNLAAAFARSGAKTVLADLDQVFGDVGPALGLSLNGDSPSLSDLAAVSRELTGEHLDRVTHEHPEGFRVLPAPPRMSDSRQDPAVVAGIVAVLRRSARAGVLHLPRSVDAATRKALELADQAVVVVTLDVVGIRAARRLVDHLRSLGLADNLSLVINRASRGEVVPEDAARVLGLPLLDVIPSDGAVERAQNRGELVMGRRGRLTRRISTLASLLLERAKP